MNDAQDLEQRLRDDLQSRTSSSYNTAIGLSAIARGSARRRKRSLVAVAATTGAVATISGMSLVAVNMTAHPSHREPATVASSGANSTDATQSKEIFKWAEGLPRGPEPTVPYLVGTLLHLPNGAQVALPGEAAGLIGTGPNGTVVLLESKNNTRSNRYILVSATGDITELGSAVMTNAQDALVDPTGQMFTNGDEIVSLQTGEKVGEIPREATVMYYWSSAGIVYLTAGGGAVLWDPGTAQKHQLDEHPGQATKGSDAFIKTEDDCSTISIATPGRLALARTLCDAAALASSSDGSYVLTYDFDAVDTGGAPVDMDNSPTGSRPYQADIRWLGSSAFLVSLGDGQDRDPNQVRSILVNCDLATLSCTRATDSMDVPRSQAAIQLP
jgi:hypothetical protein